MLEERLKFYAADNVIAEKKDFLQVDFNSEKYKNVRFIMADPSCSGSGMLNNMFFEKQEKDVERLLKLAKFQVNPE